MQLSVNLSLLVLASLGLYSLNPFTAFFSITLPTCQSEAAIIEAPCLFISAILGIIENLLELL
jgi:hypothetical protein